MDNRETQQLLSEIRDEIKKINQRTAWLEDTLKETIEQEKSAPIETGQPAWIQHLISLGVVIAIISFFVLSK